MFSLISLKKDIDTTADEMMGAIEQAATIFTDQPEGTLTTADLLADSQMDMFQRAQNRATAPRYGRTVLGI